MPSTQAEVPLADSLDRGERDLAHRRSDVDRVRGLRGSIGRAKAREEPAARLEEEQQLVASTRDVGRRVFIVEPRDDV